MSVAFRDTSQGLSVALNQTIASIKGNTITLRDLFVLIGEQGLLFLCALLTIPFLIPVSIPGVSTVFGAAIILISIGITLNRLPWLPGRIMDRPLETEKLIPTLRKGSDMVARIDRWIRPRLPQLTSGAVMNRINGLAILFGGILLIFPLGLIPFSNTLPAFAILFLAVGILQRDGMFVLLGYVMLVATVIYFGALALGAIAAGQGISSLIGS
jgi:hypothetical protein